MANLSLATEAHRIAQAVQVLALVTSGKTIPIACEEIGISIKQYYHWISIDTDAITALSDLSNQVARRQVALILSAQERGLQYILGDFVSSETFARDRIAIAKYLDERLAALSESQGLHGADANADEYLAMAGPSLVEGESKTRHQTTEQELDTVDAEFTELLDQGDPLSQESSES